MSSQEQQTATSIDATDIHLKLVKDRNAAVQKRVQISSPEKISRQAIVSNMAARLSASVFRNLPENRKKYIPRTKMRNAAAELLKEGIDVETVAEKLIEVFG